MTINKLVKELCKREGLKKQVDIAQIREIIGHLSDMVHEFDDLYGNDVVGALLENGRKRANRKRKGKK